MHRLLLVALLGLVGCGSHSCETKTEPTSEECPGCNECCSAKSRAEMLQKSAEELKVITGEQLTKEIETHAGKVVCVFVWGSYHRPSIIQLPEVVALQNKFTEGVSYITICHAPPETRKMAAGMLLKAKCHVPTFAISDNEEIAEARIWMGLSLPAMIVVGRDGKVAARIQSEDGGSSSIGFDAIEEAVKQALNNK